MHLTKHQKCRLARLEMDEPIPYIITAEGIRLLHVRDEMVAIAVAARGAELTPAANYRRRELRDSV